MYDLDFLIHLSHAGTSGGILFDSFMGTDLKNKTEDDFLKSFQLS